MLNQTFHQRARLLGGAMVFVCVCFFSVSPACAQWVDVDSSFIFIETTNQYQSVAETIHIHAFASEGSNLFAGLLIDTGNDVLRSTDYGSDWSDTLVDSAYFLYKTIGAISGSVYSLFANGPIVLAGIGAVANGVSHSSDSGKTWSQRDSFYRVYNVVAFTAIGTYIFAGSSDEVAILGGVHRSTDSGATWDTVNHGLPNNTGISSLVAMGSDLFAGTSVYGVFQSTDSGANWTAANTGLSPDSLWLHKFGVALYGTVTSFAVIGTNLFAGFANDPTFSLATSAGVLLSTDSGANWRPVNNGLTGRRISSLAVSCSNLFTATDSGIFRSTDLGTNWVPINQGAGRDLSTALRGSTLGVCGPYLFAGAPAGGIWRLSPLWVSEQLPAGSSGDTVQASACGSNFSFTSQYTGTCTFATLDSVFITGLNAGEYQISHTAHATEPDTSWITVTPESPGMKSLRVTARYVDDESNIIDTSFPLVLESSPAQSLSISVKPGQLSATSQSLVSIPLYASSADSVTGTNLKFRLDLRTDLLTPVSVSTPMVGATASIQNYDSAGVWITISLPANFSISSDTLIATVTCRVFVTDTEETAISVESIAGEAPNCLSINGAGAETFTLLARCGDLALTEFLAHDVTAITSIVPNPAGSMIEVGVRNAGTGGAIEIYDALGRKAMELTNQANRDNTGITSDFDVNVSTLPAGVYMVRYTLGSYSSGRPVVIIH